MAAVLRALKDAADVDLTAIVTTADDGGSSGVLRERRGGPAVGDLRRSLVALSDDAPLARAFTRTLTINRLGSHPIGNLMLTSIADAFGDLGEATEWLGAQLRLSGRVLPASTEPVTLLAATDQDWIRGESAIGAAAHHIRRLHFSPERPSVHSLVLESIDAADWVLIAPGSLFTSVLAVASIPDVAAALERTHAPIVWICNLVAEAVETAGMTASDHLDTLRRHGVPVDVALYDVEADLSLDPALLSQANVFGSAHPMRSDRVGVHDPVKLKVALDDLFASYPPLNGTISHQHA
jgi:uncharacterized cofD-like protein